MNDQVAAKVAAGSVQPLAGSPSQSSRKLRKILSLDDFEAAARAALPRLIFGYIAESVERRQSFRETANAFQDYSFRPRVLTGVAPRTQETQLLGRQISSPIGVAPMGVAALAAKDGDVVLARAAEAAGVPFILSSSSLTPLERVAREAPHSWFQAYLPGDPTRILPMLDRVAAAGIGTLVITVDVAVIGNRENDVRQGFSMPIRPSLSLALQLAARPAWLWWWGLSCLRDGIPHFENNDATRGPPVLARSLARNILDRDRFDWSHIALIRSHWAGRLVLKGILRGDDAALARDHGVDGVIVSNHGGRQLDGAMAPLRALPDVINAAGKMAVMLDGGIRRGTDVLKALSLGASTVFVGRPLMFAAAVAGEAGVRHGLALLRSEIDRDMALLGVRSLADLGPDLLAKAMK